MESWRQVRSLGKNLQRALFFGSTATKRKDTKESKHSNVCYLYNQDFGCIVFLGHSLKCRIFFAKRGHGFKKVTSEEKDRKGCQQGWPTETTSSGVITSSLLVCA